METGILTVKIRPMKKSDIDDVVNIEAKAYGEHHWSKESFYNELSNDISVFITEMTN